MLKILQIKIRFTILTVMLLVEIKINFTPTQLTLEYGVC